MATHERSPLLGDQEDTDEEIVWWDGPEDPENPLNWAQAKKWSHVVIVSLATFLVYVRLRIYLVASVFD